MAQHHETGKYGEQLATDYLKRKGFTVYERNWRHQQVEVDIIGQYKEFLVFVEVKTRHNKQFGLPEEAVGVHKQDCLYQAAVQYLEEYESDREVRFDIVSIVLNDPESPEIHHIPDAFFPAD